MHRKFKDHIIISERILSRIMIKKLVFFACFFRILLKGILLGEDGRKWC
jgi:hypothetical protein